MAQLVLEGEGSNYGLQVQISYIKKMFHENLTPSEVYNLQTPLHVSRRTIYAWWKHFKLYGETPWSTNRRRLELLKELGVRRTNESTRRIVPDLIRLVENNPYMYYSYYARELTRLGHGAISAGNVQYPKY